MKEWIKNRKAYLILLLISVLVILGIFNRVIYPNSCYTPKDIRAIEAECNRGTCHIYGYHKLCEHHRFTEDYYVNNYMVKKMVGIVFNGEFLHLIFKKL